MYLSEGGGYIVTTSCVKMGEMCLRRKGYTSPFFHFRCSMQLHETAIRAEEFIQE